MNRRLFLLTPIIANVLLANQNFCEEDFFKKISTAKKDSRNIKNSSQQRLIFDESATLDLINDFNKNLSANSKNIQKYNKDRMFWNTISYIAMFTYSDIIKKEILTIYTNYKKEVFTNYSYKNLLALKNIGGLNNEKIFLEQIKDTSNDMLFKIFYQINFNIPLNVNQKTIDLCKKDLDLNLSFCKKRELLNKVFSNLDFLTIFKLFIYSKIFLNQEENIKKYFYAISNDISTWEYLEYIYYKEKKNLLAGQKLQVFFGLEGESNNLKRFVATGYVEVAENAFNIRNYEQSWDYAVLSIKLILTFEDFSKKDMALFLKSKTILQKSSKELINIYIQKKEQSLIEHIYKQTNSLLDSMPRIKG